MTLCRKKIIGLSIVFIIIVAMIAFFLLTPNTSEVLPWNTPVQLTHTNDVATSPAVVEYGDKLYLFYAERKQSNPTKLAYIYGSWADFSDPHYLTNESFFPTDIHAIIFSSKIYVFWEDTRAPIPRICVVYGNGNKWSEPAEITNGRYPSAAVWNGKLYVAYSGVNGYGIYLSYLNNENWEHLNISTEGRSPRLIVVGNNMVIIWSESGFIKGALLTEDLKLSQVTTLAKPGENMLRIQFSTYNTGFYLVWSQHISGTNYDIYVRQIKINDNTLSPLDIYRVSNTSAFSTEPVISYVNDHLYVSWSEKQNDKYYIMMRFFYNKKWSAYYTVTPKNINCRTPHLFKVHSKLYLLWERYDSTVNIWGAEINV